MRLYIGNGGICRAHVLASHDSAGSAMGRALHKNSASATAGVGMSLRRRLAATQDSENLRYCEMDIKDAPGLKDARCDSPNQWD